MLLNKNTDLNQRTTNRKSLLENLFEKDSRKRILEILEIFHNILDIKKFECIVNFINLNVDHLNINFFLKIFPELKTKDEIGWNLFNYLLWKKRTKNLNYYLIFNY